MSQPPDPTSQTTKLPITDSQTQPTPKSPIWKWIVCLSALILVTGGALLFLYLYYCNQSPPSAEKPTVEGPAVASAKSSNVLLPPVRSENDEVRRKATAIVRLQKIAGAVAGFADRSDNRVPNNIYGAGQKPLLSWRVAILSDLGYEALYKEFHLQEPWDSEHNKKLIAKMPEEYALPGVHAPEPGTTFLQGFVGPAGIQPRALFMHDDRQGITMELPDGTSNTALCVEAANAVPWTKPEDIEFDFKNPPLKFGGHHGPWAFVLFVNGKAYLAPLSGFTAQSVRGMATINGDERFDFP